MPRHTYRILIHGHLIEGRIGSWGDESVIVDGRLVSEHPLAGIFSRSHFFTLVDESGRERSVEVRWDSVFALLGARGKPPMLVLVDGKPRARLKPLLELSAMSLCYGCGYELRGLQAEKGEVRCPECGRHTREWEMGDR